MVLDFCKLAADFLQNGPNTKRYFTAAQKLEVDTDLVTNCVYGVVNLLLIACKNKVGTYLTFVHVLIHYVFCS